MSPKMLIVDDESDIIEPLSTMFKAKGFDVTLALDGQEGLNKAKEMMPDIIILDEMLPKMDGLKICGLLKAEARFRKIPIILYSARAFQDDELKMIEETGFYIYVSKLIEFDELLTIVNKALDEHKSAAS